MSVRILMQVLLHLLFSLAQSITTTTTCPLHSASGWAKDKSFAAQFPSHFGACDLDTLDVSQMARADFVAQHRGRRPVILTGLNLTKLAHNWRKDDFLHQYGDMKVNVRRNNVAEYPYMQSVRDTVASWNKTRVHRVRVKVRVQHGHDSQFRTALVMLKVRPHGCDWSGIG